MNKEKENTSIKKIIIEIEGQEIKCTLAGLKKLKGILNELLGKEVVERHHWHNGGIGGIGNWYGGSIGGATWKLSDNAARYGDRTSLEAQTLEVMDDVKVNSLQKLLNGY